MRSRLIDRGRERMLVFPTEQVEDSRGNKFYHHSDKPVSIRVTASEDRGSDAELSGQVAVKVLRITTRRAPVDSYARILFRGEEWDVAAPPIFTTGSSESMRHVEFNIRSRNNPEEIQA